MPSNVRLNFTSSGSVGVGVMAARRMMSSVFSLSLLLGLLVLTPLFCGGLPTTNSGPTSATTTTPTTTTPTTTTTPMTLSTTTPTTGNSTTATTTSTTAIPTDRSTFTLPENPHKPTTTPGNFQTIIVTEAPPVKNETTPTMTTPTMTSSTGTTTSGTTSSSSTEAPTTVVATTTPLAPGYQTYWIRFFIMADYSLINSSPSSPAALELADTLRLFLADQGIAQDTILSILFSPGSIIVNIQFSLYSDYVKAVYLGSDGFDIKFRGILYLVSLTERSTASSSGSGLSSLWIIIIVACVVIAFLVLFVLVARAMDKAKEKREPHISNLDKNGFGDIHYAIAENDEEAVNLLIQECNVIASEEEEAPQKEAMEALLGLQDSEGNSPVIWATRLSRLPILKLLLSHGAPVNLRNALAQTAAHIACINADSAALQILVEHQIDVNIPDKQGLTPFHQAARNCFLNGMLILRVAGANVNQYDHRGMTSLMLGASLSSPEVVSLLLDMPEVKPDLQDAQGWTALHWAAAVGDYDSCSLLLTCPRVNPGLKTRNGETSLHMAARTGNKDVLRLFLSDARCLSYIWVANDQNKSATDVARLHGNNESARIIKDTEDNFVAQGQLPPEPKVIVRRKKPVTPVATTNSDTLSPVPVSPFDDQFDHQDLPLDDLLLLSEPESHNMASPFSGDSSLHATSPQPAFIDFSTFDFDTNILETPFNEPSFGDGFSFQQTFPIPSSSSQPLKSYVGPTQKKKPRNNNPYDRVELQPILPQMDLSKARAFNGQQQYGFPHPQYGYSQQFQQMGNTLPLI